MIEPVAKATKGRMPLRVMCTQCGHAWIALYLPLQLAEAARVLAALHCPFCAADASNIHAY